MLSLLPHLLFELLKGYPKSIALDGSLDDRFEVRLNGGPPDYAVKDVGGNVSSIFLLKFDHFRLSTRFLLNFCDKRHICTLFHFLLMKFGAFRVPIWNVRTLKLLRFEGIVVLK